MITYELAKELKDAGFTQGEYMNYTCQHEDPFSCRLSSKGSEALGCELVAVPNLAELIEACGGLFGLTHDYDKWNAYDHYFIDGAYEDGSYSHFAEGASPEEAVARLWLTLNEK